MKLCVPQVQSMLFELTPSISRLRVLCGLNKLGIYLTSEKQQALLRGDISGAVIHPFFIRTAHYLGIHFCKETGNPSSMIALEAKYYQEALELWTEMLRETSQRRNWELQAQVALWMIIGSVISQRGDATPSYLKTACNAVNTGGLQFIPAWGRPPAFSDDLHEKLSVLSQIVYFENFLFLTCNGARPTMAERIEIEFTHNLQV